MPSSLSFNTPDSSDKKKKSALRHLGVNQHSSMHFYNRHCSICKNMHVMFGAEEDLIRSTMVFYGFLVKNAIQLSGAHILAIRSHLNFIVGTIHIHSGWVVSMEPSQSLEFYGFHNSEIRFFLKTKPIENYLFYILIPDPSPSCPPTFLIFSPPSPHPLLRVGEDSHGEFTKTVTSLEVVPRPTPVSRLSKVFLHRLWAPKSQFMY